MAKRLALYTRTMHHRIFCWLNLDDLRSPGEGKILKLDGRKMAIYCDSDGKVEKVSAVVLTWAVSFRGTALRKHGIALVTALVFGPTGTLFPDR